MNAFLNIGGNVYAMSSGGFRTTHFKFRNNDKKENKTSRTD